MDALSALAELLSERLAPPGATVTTDVELVASDRASLLVEWMEELLYRADVEGLIPRRVRALELYQSGLRARVHAVRGSPSPLVKAVTYHGLRFERTDGRFRATVVLDV